MQVESEQRVRLGSFENVDFGEHQHYVVQDLRFLNSVATRMVEDVELVAYILARRQEAERIDAGTMADAVYLYCQENAETFGEAPAEAIVNPEFVARQAKSPFPHDEEAILLISRFVNYRLIDALTRAAAQAREEGTHVITALHFSWCHLLPYPFNIYLC